MVAATTQRRLRQAAAAALLGFPFAPAAPAADPAPVGFEKVVLTDKYYCDGVTTADVNRDGKLDVIAGPYWYAGPDFKVRREFYPAQLFETAPAPTDSMFSYAHDFNGDGWPDILVLGRIHKHAAHWYENPGKDGVAKPGHWKKHFAFERVKGESPPFVDVDGDGKPELVTHWDNCWGFVRPDWAAPAKPWTFTPITAVGKYDQFYHGTGIGDVDGDGQLDLILNDGWWEQPPRDAGPKEWPAHPFKFDPKGGAQMFASDVDGDGRADVVTSLDAHGWGLAWFRQVGPENNVTFEKHVIMGSRDEEAKYGAAFSQPHALAMADLDGDGLPDLVAGKRMWAHGPKGDVEPEAAPVLYWFRLVREPGKEPRFVPHLIDDKSGVGVQVTVADVNGDGRPDVLTASKLGVFLFVNRPQQPRQ